ncbi:hypothetical protein GC722_03935 [Auraticoccus sp. F435]|uniref:Neutral zinc metallopeptidase n=1 Tax=Auraticoccus cholistanensis TaxID=2656650 RepID=A0A6A9UR14_9ACTN|nr:hypothetical protein [Auraticoccus cholistanensis]
MAQTPAGSGGAAPRRAARPRGRGLLLALVAATAVVLAVAAVLVTRAGGIRLPGVAATAVPEPAPGTPAAPSSGARATSGPGVPGAPSGGPAPPGVGGPVFPIEARPDDPFTGTGLDDNRLYAVVAPPASLGCPAPALRPPPVPDEELQAHAEDVVGCLVQALAPLLAEQGLELTAPAVATFDDDLRTPCGLLAVADYPAYYCSTDATIYLNARTDDTAFNYARLERGYWLVLAHEVGHHLQHTAGIFPLYSEAWDDAEEDERLELTRRLELQATCFAGVQLNLLAGTLQLPADTDEQLTAYARENNDEVTGTRDHGDADSTESWLLAGFDRGWGSFGYCRTWSAEDADVS